MIPYIFVVKKQYDKQFSLSNMPHSYITTMSLSQIHYIDMAGVAIQNTIVSIVNNPVFYLYPTFFSARA